MSRLFVCDRCSEQQKSPSNMGNHRPTGWSSVRINIRGKRMSTPIEQQYQLCGTCTHAISKFFTAVTA